MKAVKRHLIGGNKCVDRSERAIIDDTGVNIRLVGHPARFETRARERRRGQVYPKSDLATRRSFRYRSGETNRDDVPVGWLETIWWRLRTEIHGRFSPAQLPAHVARSTDHHLRRWPSYFRQCRETGSYTDLCSPAILPPISIFSIEISSIFILKHHLDPNRSFSIVNFNPWMDEKFPKVDFLSQNYLTSSSSKLLLGQSDFLPDGKKLFWSSILRSIFDAVDRFLPIFSKLKEMGYGAKKKKADTADKFFTGEIHRWLF